MKKVFGVLGAVVLALFLSLSSASASFMSEIADDVGSGATAEVGNVIAGPVGSIIFYVMAIGLIGFIVSSIVMWYRGRKG